MIKVEQLNDFKIEFMEKRDKHNELFVAKLAEIHEIKKSLFANYQLENFPKIQSLTNLLKDFSPKLKKFYEEISPNFNVFRILGLHNKEVITHTPFIAYLLSPWDEHKQSDLFLRKFLKRFKFSDINFNDWYVQKEFENIDLRIVNEKTKTAIFIENKIYTDAHSGQISRYFEHWKNYYEKGEFIYLSINGSMPSDNGFDENCFYTKIEIIKKMKLMSYKTDINNWLEDCYDEIKSDKVKYTVLQYMELIKHL